MWRGVNNGPGLVLVKVIIETCYLSTKLKKMACKIVEDTGADFVKTSTGFGPRGPPCTTSSCCATPSASASRSRRSGGIRTYDDVERLINAGAARIGTSAGGEIMDEFYARQ